MQRTPGHREYGTASTGGTRPMSNISAQGQWNQEESIWSCFLFFFLFAFSRATRVARGGSQARGRIGAVATGYRATATWDPSLVCDLYHSSWQRWILNPLSEARDRTRNLMVPAPGELLVMFLLSTNSLSRNIRERHKN